MSLHEYVAQKVPRNGEWEHPKFHLGEVIMASIEDGLTVEAVRFEEASHIDIGTLEDLRVAVEG